MELYHHCIDYLKRLATDEQKYPGFNSSHGGSYYFQNATALV